MCTARQRRNKAGTIAVALVALVALSGCGAATSVRATPAAAVEQPQEVPAPTRVQVAVVDGELAVTWQVAEAPDTGFEVYVDQETPVVLPPTARVLPLGPLEAGREHLIQVVAVASYGQSRPSSTSYAPAAPRPSSVVTEEEPQQPAPQLQPVQQQPAPQQQPASQQQPVQQPARQQQPVQQQPAPQQPAQPQVLTVSGSFSTYFVWPASVAEGGDSRRCDPRTWTMPVQDASGATIALAEISAGRLVERELDEYVFSYGCEHTYSAAISGASPTYSFTVESRLEAKSDAQRVTRSAISGGKGPAMRATYCNGCSR